MYNSWGEEGRWEGEGGRGREGRVGEGRGGEGRGEGRGGEEREGEVGGGRGGEGEGNRDKTKQECHGEVKIKPMEQ